MTRRQPDPRRELQGVELTYVVGGIAARLSRETGDDELQCARDLHAAIDRWVGSRVALAKMQGETWKQIGDRLGVSAQAAQQKYGPRRSRPHDFREDIHLTERISDRPD